MKIESRKLLAFIRLTRPHFLVGGFLLYGLGASIAAYLGKPIDLGLYILGQLLVTAIQLTTHYLNEYFDGSVDIHNPNRTWMNGGSGELGESGLSRKTALYAAIVTLTITAIVVSMLILRGGVSLLAWSFVLIGFFGAYFYNAPPLRWIVSGYGELIASIIVAAIVPALAYSLQTGELHRLLLMSTSPLVALHFAMIMVFELPDYGTDLKYEKKTLMVRLGWEVGMRMHDIAILFAVISYILAILAGLPTRVALGGLIALPLALAQVWQMGRIREGYPPRWQLFTLSATGLFALAAYLELMGYLLS